MCPISIGYCLCGSFCTLERSIAALQALAEQGYDLHPIMSEITYATDTRFGRCQDFREQIEAICGRPVLHTIPQVEPIGPKAYLDALVVAPCTGNTLGKLAHGIYDTSVTMAVKAQLRNHRPVVLAVSTNDGLGNSAQSIGRLMAVRGVYFVPMAQDDPVGKPESLVADLTHLEEAVCQALQGHQLQPVYVCR